MIRRFILGLLTLAIPSWTQPAILQIRVIEGEGAVYAIGARATRGLTVQVTDETGKPVEGASVSFRLPDEGPTGTFTTGARTEIVTTGPDGRASVWGMQWNRTAGQLQIRVTAMKGAMRAGTIVPAYLSDQVTANPPQPGGSRFGRKWVIVSLIAAGVAGAGVAARTSGGQTASAAAAVSAPRIGQPSISLGRP